MYKNIGICGRAVPEYGVVGILYDMIFFFESASEFIQILIDDLSSIELLIEPDHDNFLEKLSEHDCIFDALLYNMHGNNTLNVLESTKLW